VRETACRLIVFDLFGTTVADDGSVEVSLRAVLDAHHVVHDEAALRQVRGRAKRDAIGELAGDARAGEVESIYTAFARELRSRWAAHPLQPVDAALDVFHALEAHGVRLAMTTGLERDLARPVLDVLRWPAARPAVCAEDVPHGRPAPDMIQRAMAVSGIADADAVACVGDTVSDLRAAAAAGVRWNIGAAWGAHGEARLRAEPHTAIIGSLRDLPAAIGLARPPASGR
jgi:phosphonatase-like hydrolase